MSSFAMLAAAVALRWLLDPVVGDALPLVTLFGAVAAAVWLGGLGPAIAVRSLGYSPCDYLFIAPRGALADRQCGRTSSGLVAYLFTCALIIAIGEAMRAAQAREAESRELLRVTLRQHRRRGHHHRHRGPRDLPERGRRDADRLDARARRVGQPLETVFRIVNETTRRAGREPGGSARCAKASVVGLANHTVLIAQDGTERPIDDSAAPIRDEHGRVSGCVLIFRDVTAQRQLEQRAAAAAARGAPARLDRRIVGRRDHQQVARRRHPELERGAPSGSSATPPSRPSAGTSRSSSRRSASPRRTRSSRR